MSGRSPPRIDPVEKLVLFYKNKTALDSELHNLEQKQADLEQKQADLVEKKRGLLVKIGSILTQIDTWNDKNNIIERDLAKLNEYGCKEEIMGALSKPEATIESIKDELYKGKCAHKLPPIGIKAGGSKRRNRRKNRKSRKN